MQFERFQVALLLYFNGARKDLNEDQRWARSAYPAISDEFGVDPDLKLFCKADQERIWIFVLGFGAQ